MGQIQVSENQSANTIPSERIINLKSENSEKLKIGDLVKIKSYCESTQQRIIFIKYKNGKPEFCCFNENNIVFQVPYTWCKKQEYCVGDIVLVNNRYNRLNGYVGTIEKIVADDSVSCEMLGSIVHLKNLKNLLGEKIKSDIVFSDTILFDDILKKIKEI